VSRLRVFTWHVHGNYLWYLSRVPVEWYVPVAPGRPAGYGGRTHSFPWPDNLHEVPVDDVRDLDIDCVLFQSHGHWLADQYRVLSERQRRLPRVFLEHDPPREQPTETRHPVDDREVLIVHVTHFNKLMWNNGESPTTVIEHGVDVPAHVRATYSLPRGIVVVNNIKQRGRRLGYDVFLDCRSRVPLDLVGMESLDAGGLGEIPNADLPGFVAEYRFFFNPIRYTSLGLAILESMQAGLPVIGLATTELVTVVQDGVHGYVDTDVEVLVDRMRALLDDPRLAAELGENARVYARKRFGIDRFAADWHRTLHAVAGSGAARSQLCQQLAR
jgi:Glycosyl transferases group 1